MNSIRFAQFTVTFVAQVDMELPTNKCPLFYSGFGCQIINVFCDQKKHVTPEIPHTCLYDSLFRGKVQTLDDIHVPPYAVQCDNTETNLKKGQRLEFIFITAYIKNFWPKLLLIWKKMAERGIGGSENENTFKLTRVRLNNPFTEQSKIIATNKEYTESLPDSLLITEEHIISRAKDLGDKTKVKIQFITPWQIRIRDTSDTNQHIRALCPSFSDLIDGLVHRAEHFALGWGNQKFEWAAEKLPQLAEGLDSTDNLHWIRNTFGPRKDKQRSGVIGDMIITGPNIKPFLPLLIFGELIHVGRSATSGHGRIKLSEI